MYDGTRILFLCTGNATRSVLGGAALSRCRPDIFVSTAGSLVVEGMPMSVRTRAGFAAIGLDAPDHRSRQATGPILADHNLIVAMAPEHVYWVRREYASAASRTGTLKRLCRDLSSSDAPLAERVAALCLGTLDMEEWEEVVDPGGSEVDRFVERAIEVNALIDQLAGIL